MERRVSFTCCSTSKCLKFHNCNEVSTMDAQMEDSLFELPRNRILKAYLIIRALFLFILRFGVKL